MQQAYNILFTALPTLLLGVFDQDITAATALAVPELYTGARWNESYMTTSAIVGVLLLLLLLLLLLPACAPRSHGRGLSMHAAAAAVHHALAGWLLCGVWDAFPLYFLTSYAVVVGAPAGTTPGIFALGMFVVFGVLAVVNIRAAIEMKRHHWSFDLVVVIEVILLVPAAYVSDALNFNGTRGTARTVFGEPLVWLVWPLAVVAAMLPYAALTAWRRLFHPSLRGAVERILASGATDAEREAAIKRAVMRHREAAPL